MLRSFRIRTIMRVVPNQLEKFQTDPFFINLANRQEVKYTNLPHAPECERQAEFINDCRSGIVPIAYVSNGFNLELHTECDPVTSSIHHVPHCHLQLSDDSVQVCIVSAMILNGVCVKWKGTVDKNTLKGTGVIEFDEESATEEAQAMQSEAPMLEELERQLQHHLSLQQVTCIFVDRVR